MIPALIVASEDRSLGGTAFRVLVWLATHHLDVETFRAVKIVWLSSVLGMDETTVARALRTLTRAGYLACNNDRPRAYRLRWTLPRRIT